MNNPTIHRVMLTAPGVVFLLALLYVLSSHHVHEGALVEYHVGASALVLLVMAVAATWLPVYDSYRARKAAEAVGRWGKEKDVLLREVERARELYTSIVEASHDFIWVVDGEGVTQFSNSRALTLVGEQHRGIWELFEAADRTKCREAFAAVSEGQALEVELTVERGAEPIILAIAAAPLGGGGSLWEGRDVTASHRAERRIRDLEERLRAMLDNAQLFAVVGDADGTIRFVNQYLLDVTGYTAGEVVGKRWYEVFLRPGMVGYELWTVREGAPSVAEYDIVTRAGRYRRVKWSRTHFRDWQGKLIGVGSVGEDVTAREVSALALLESEKRFRGIFEQSGVGMILGDAECRTIDCNAAFRELLGVSDGQEAARRAADALVAAVPEVGDRLKALWTKQASTFDVEVSLATGSGPKMCRVSGSLLRDVTGEPTLSVCLFEDVTERWRIATQLAESREKFRSLVETTTDLVWEVDADGRYTYVSPQFVEVLGWRPDELIGRYPTELMSAGEAARIQPVIEAHLRERKTFRLVTNVNLHRDGREVVLETSGTPLFSADGAFLGFHGIDRDVTERERARGEMARLVTAIEAAGDAIIITARDGTIDYVNPAFERITGYNRWELDGLTPRVLKSGRQPAELYDGLWAALIRGERWDGHFVNRRKDGSLYEAEVTISPIESQGVITGFVAVQRDVSERIALLQRLQRAEEMERLGRLLAGVAHEVRNPLNAIQAATATLELDHGADPDSRAMFQVVHAQVERLTKLMYDLLELAKPVLDRQRITVNNLCREALSIWCGSHPEDAARVHCTCEELGAEVEVDSVRIQQVIINLVDNALQHSPAGASIEVGCDVTGAQARIYVVDAGTGLPPGIAEKIFDPFFTTRRAGTGLGLSLVKNIVELHNGRVRISNRQESAGAIAEVFLPLAVQENA